MNQAKALSYGLLALFFLQALLPDLERQLPGAKWLITAGLVVSAAYRSLDYWRSDHGHKKEQDAEGPGPQ